MTLNRCGSRTLVLSSPVYLVGGGSAVGRREGEGPLPPFFDYIAADDSLGCPTWEQSEQEFQKKALSLALDQAGLTADRLDALFAGDLLNQCVASSFAARGLDIPYLGLYGACSTFGEGLILAAMALDGGFFSSAGVAASSHFCTAERQYRTPLEYGGQRTPTAQWTVTGAGASILSREGSGPRITHLTPGKIVDLGITDTGNMGAAMAPAACDTIAAHLKDSGRSPDFYDLIVTGDLGSLGSQLLLELLGREGISLSNHRDCGMLIFDPSTQDIHAGGSGAGCCACVLNGYLMNGLRSGHWKNLLFCPTGALHSPTTALQGDSIPGICHAVAITTEQEDA